MKKPFTLENIKYSSHGIRYKNSKGSFEQSRIASAEFVDADGNPCEITELFYSDRCNDEADSKEEPKVYPYCLIEGRYEVSEC